MSKYKEFVRQTLLNDLLYPSIPSKINESVVKLEYLIDSMYENIHLLDIKKPSSNFEATCDTIQSNTSPTQTKIEFKKAGTTSMAFRIKIGKHKFALKVTAYKKTGDNGNNIANIKRPENVELRMSSILSSFVLDGYTPHINVCIGYCLCDIKEFICHPDVPLSDKHKYSVFLQNYEKKQFEENVLVTISEWANAGDLHEFLKENHKDMTKLQWKIILFQVIFTLHIIHCKFPNFRHNDLKINNVLVNYEGKYKNTNKKATYIATNNLHFSIPLNTCISSKIMDFDFSCIEKYVENEKVNTKWTDKINVNKQENKYYDIFFFFKTLTLYIDKAYIPDEILSFIYEIIPPDLSLSTQNCSEKGRLLINEEITNCYKILTHDIFKEFRK